MILYIYIYAERERERETDLLRWMVASYKGQFLGFQSF